MANLTIQGYAKVLTTNERAGHDFTHIFAFGPTNTNNFATQTTAGDGVIFNLFTAVAGTVMVKWALVCDPALQNSADAAFNTNAVSFGDAGSATRFLNAVQVNANGTPTTYTYGNTAYVFTADSLLSVLIAGQAAKKMSDLNTGKI